MSRIKARLTKLEQRCLDKTPIVLFTRHGDAADEERIAEAERQAKAQGRPLTVWTIVYVHPDPKDRPVIRSDQKGKE